MIISFSGHRPEQLGGYKVPNPTYDYVCSQIEEKLIELKPEKVLTGMALGVDSWVANICIKLNIPFVSVIPFTRQDQIWPEESKKEYRRLLSLASEQVIVSPGNFAGWKMQKRNEYLVDNCDKLIAIIKKDCVKGGTFNCVRYALKQNKELIYINPP